MSAPAQESIAAREEPQDWKRAREDARERFSANIHHPDAVAEFGDPQTAYTPEECFHQGFTEAQAALAACEEPTGEVDDREWTAVGEQAGAARAGETMWSGPHLKPGERVTVVPKSRLAAREEPEWTWARLYARLDAALLDHKRAQGDPKANEKLWTIHKAVDNDLFGRRARSDTERPGDFRSASEFEQAMFPKDVERRQREVESPSDAGRRCAEEALGVTEQEPER